MTDLYIGIAVIVVISVIAFAMAIWTSRHCSQPMIDLLAFCVVVGIFAYIRYVWYHTRLATWLPFSNLIVIGNWFPIAAAALAGFVWNRVPGRTWRKAFSAIGLVTAASYALIWPMCGKVPSCANVWTKEGICLQTTARTCTPACAATLLRLCGIAATEQEMAELCLTREGTTWPGLYRGLKRKTAGTVWDVEVYQGDVNNVIAQADHPSILSVGLPSATAMQEHATNSEWGWKHGIGHSVTLLGTTNHGRLVIADPVPGIGREEWTADDLRFLFRGTEMRLVRRN
jgi:hypothetical protein